jgi:hypothetical protein
MKRLFAVRRATTALRSEDFIEDSSVTRPVRRSVRTLDPNDRIIDTSLSINATLRDAITHLDKAADVIADTAAEPWRDDEDFEPDDRARSLVALLLRKESLALLERVMSTDNPTEQRERLGELMLSSHDALYSFSRLVTEGGLTTSGGLLLTTPLTDRILNTIGEDVKP